MTYRKDPEKVRAYNKAYYAANRDRERARAAEYRLAHLERYAENRRRWFAEHPGYQRARYQSNPEPERARSRAWTKARPEYVRLKSAKRYRDHPEQFVEYRKRSVARRAAYMKTWRATNPEATATHKLNRRARIKGNGGTHTSREWLEKVDLFAGCCVYCGEARPLVRDHNVPLLRGGTNHISNILPACRSCNAKKFTMTAREFLAATAA